MVPGGHLSVILVVIIGFRQWGVRKGQNMAQNRPRLYIYVVANVQIQLMYTLAGRVANVYIS